MRSYQTDSKPIHTKQILKHLNLLL